MAGFAEQEELWAGPQFSAAPGFSDDFQKLLGAVMPDSQPIALQASQHTFSSSQNDTTMDLSPIPRENQTTNSVLSTMDPPVLGQSDGNKYEPILHQRPDPTLPVAGGGLSQFTQQVPSYMKTAELPNNPFLPQPQHQRTNLNNNNPFLDGINQPNDANVLESLPPEVIEPSVPQLSSDGISQAIVSHVPATMEQHNYQQHLQPTNSILPVVAEAAQEELPSQQRELMNGTQPHSLNGHHFTNGDPVSGTERRDHFIQRGRAALSDWRSGRNLPEEPPSPAAQNTAVDTSELLQQYAQKIEQLEKELDDKKKELFGTKSEDYQMAKAETAKWETLYQEMCDKNLSQSREAEHQRVMLTSEIAQQYNNTINELTAEVTNLRNESLNSSQQMTAQNQQNEETVKRLTTESDMLRQQLSDPSLSAELQSCKYQLQQKEQEIGSIRRNYDDVISSLKDEVQLATAASPNVTEYQKQISTLVGENTILKQQQALSQVPSSIADVSDQYESRIREQVAVVAEQENKISLLTAELSELYGKLNTSTGSVDQVQTAEYERKIQERDNLILVLQNNSSSADKESDAKQIAELNSSVQKFEAESKALNSENERLAEKLQERELNGSNTDGLINERNALKQSLTEMMNGGQAERITHLETQVVKLTGELASRQGSDTDIDNLNALVARNEQLETQLASSQLSDPNYSAVMQDYTSKLHQANVKEREWFRERERHLTHQNRLEHENENQINKIAELEEQVSELRKKTQTEEVSTTIIKAGESTAPPAVVKAGSDYYVEFSRETDDVTGITMNREVRRPLPNPAINAENYVPPEHPENGKMLIKHPLPLSVMVFDAIFSLGGLLPSTRHPRPQVVIGDRFEI